MDEAKQPDAVLSPEARRKWAIAVSVNVAMQEVIQENRAEIMRRAREKVLKLGFEVAAGEMGVAP